MAVLVAALLVCADRLLLLDVGLPQEEQDDKRRQKHD